VVKQRERRRLMFLETEAGVVGSAEKFVGRSLSDVVQARIDARDDKVDVEEIEDEDDDDDDDGGEEGVVQLNERAKASRAERKSRKAMAKLGMQPVAGITRATIRKTGNILFAVAQPDVYRCSEGSYVIFGEAKVEAMDTAANATADASAAGVQAQAQSAASEEEEEEQQVVDETGLAGCDIELVMAQTSSSRARAANALRQADGDVVGAIMALTM
jgi:nascent polypeptide-associated complex subunit alpha